MINGLGHGTIFRIHPHFSVNATSRNTTDRLLPTEVLRGLSRRKHAIARNECIRLEPCVYTSILYSQILTFQFFLIRLSQFQIQFNKY